MLIAICGIDGSGKTTQVDRLAEALSRHRTVHLTRQPTTWYRSDSAVRALLDQEFDGQAAALHELALFAATDRLRHLRTEVVPRLQAGDTVITDRYVYSTYAYFLARGLHDIEWLKAINRAAPRPELTVYLDVPPELARERIFGRDGGSHKREEVDMHRMAQVRHAFLTQPWGPSPEYHVVDGTQPRDAIARRIAGLVQAAGRAHPPPAVTASAGV